MFVTILVSFSVTCFVANNSDFTWRRASLSDVTLPSRDTPDDTRHLYVSCDRVSVTVTSGRLGRDMAGRDACVYLTAAAGDGC